MSNMFNNMGFDPKVQRSMLMSKYNAARMNLLLVVAFTAINLVMLATGSGSYFLFSATVPYIITVIGMMMCGMLPEEFYEGMEGIFFIDESFFYITLAISVLILALYLLCWIFSKKKSVWLTIALVLFAIDTVVMFLYYGIALDMILDIVFHGWVIWILVSGINANKKLKNLPEEPVVIEGEFTEIPVDEAPDEETVEIEAQIEAPVEEVAEVEAQIEAPIEETDAEENSEEPAWEIKSEEN